MTAYTFTNCVTSPNVVLSLIKNICVGNQCRKQYLVTNREVQIIAYKCISLQIRMLKMVPYYTD